MARRSSIDQLPHEIRDVCLRLIRDGRTIHEITTALNELDADVSKSAVGRYVKSTRELMQRHLAAQDIAGRLIAQLGENPQGDVGALLAEMLKTIAFQLMADMGTDGGELDPEAAAELRAKPMDIMLLAKGLDHLERAGAIGFKRRLEIERLVLARQAKAAESVAKQQGLSTDQWAAIRAKFLGIQTDDGASAP